MMRGRNVLWSGLDAAAAAGLSCVSAFVIAGLIGPAEVGVGAAAIALHVMLWVLLTASFADAIVQRPVLSAEDGASAFWAAIVAGAGLGLVQAGSGLLLSPLLHDARLTPMSLALASPLPLVGAAAVAQGLATRGRAYRRLAVRTVLGQGLGAAAGLAAAARGGGAWAIVIQQAVGSGAGALTLLLATGLLPRPPRRFHAASELLRLGVPLALSTLLQTARYRLFALLLGATAGAGPLGQIHLAFRLVDTLRDLASTALWRLMLPGLSERQHDPIAQLAAADRYLATYGRLLFPAFGAVALLAGPAIEVALGAPWQAAADATPVLVAVAAAAILMASGATAAIARGRTRLFLVSNVWNTALTCALCLALRPATPKFAALVLAAAQFASLAWTEGRIADALGSPWMRPLRGGLRPFAAAGLAVAAGLLLPRLLVAQPGPAMLAVLRLAIAGFVYVPSAFLPLHVSAWRPGRESAT
jgi:O-antigen/teichoic acid export membrane protein